MAPKAEKAGPVAGADLRNFDLVINSDNMPTTRTLQVARLMRQCAMTASMAETLAPMIFAVLS
jgi:hypothetical protein